jgi:hypothetical protein
MENKDRMFAVPYELLSQIANLLGKLPFEQTATTIQALTTLQEIKLTLPNTEEKSDVVNS